MSARTSSSPKPILPVRTSTRRWCLTTVLKKIQTRPKNSGRLNQFNARHATISMHPIGFLFEVWH